MANVDGKWNLVIKSSMGDQSAVLIAEASGGSLTGTFSNDEGTANIVDGKVDGNALSWTSEITVPMPMTLRFRTTVSGDTMSGNVDEGDFGTFPVEGTRE